MTQHYEALGRYTEAKEKALNQVAERNELLSELSRLISNASNQTDMALRELSNQVGIHSDELSFPKLDMAKVEDLINKIKKFTQELEANIKEANKHSKEAKKPPLTIR